MIRLLHSQPEHSPPVAPEKERGTALLLVLMALSVFSLLGLFMSLEATTGLCISDNYKSRIQASCASIAGLNHAYALMRGLDNDALLMGPDGAFDPDPVFLERAKQYEYRNPLSLDSAQTLDIVNPASDIAGNPDDGLVNTGYYSGTDGLPLIPLTGVAQKSTRPNIPDEVVTSRYFVKVTDNNGDPSETSADPADNPFFDGDGVVIVRSMGISGTIYNVTGNIRRRNSVVIHEARFRKFSLFDFGSAMVVFGSQISPSFNGEFDIDGGESPGIGVLDTDESDEYAPERILEEVPSGSGFITGAGLPVPSIEDLTFQSRSDPERSKTLDAEYLWRFVNHAAPAVSDTWLKGDQSWTSGNAPDLGVYDISQPYNAPGQNPKLTVVHGDLQMTGTVSGGGMLVVTGEFQCLDFCQYNGLVLVIGAGRTIVNTAGTGIHGGLVIASLDDSAETHTFGDPVFSILGNSRIRSNDGAVDAALSLIPPRRLSFREIAGTDP